VRLRLILPFVTGAVSVPLVIWDIHNQRVISSMGMAWDTGAPLWPYQTPHLLLYFLNYPAHFIARPVANYLELLVPQYDSFIFPIALFWWWVFGLTLDRASLRFDSRWRWPTFTALIALAAVLSCVAMSTLVNGFRWWFEYGIALWNAQTLVMLIFLAPTVWSLPYFDHCYRCEASANTVVFNEIPDWKVRPRC
jgi:hypothetical protein